MCRCIIIGQGTLSSSSGKSDEAPVTFGLMTLQKYGLQSFQLSNARQSFLCYLRIRSRLVVWELHVEPVLRKANHGAVDTPRKCSLGRNGPIQRRQCDASTTKDVATRRQPGYRQNGTECTEEAEEGIFRSGWKPAANFNSVSAYHITCSGRSTNKVRQYHLFIWQNKPLSLQSGHHSMGLTFESDILRLV